MSDDEADPELLELLRQSLGISRAPRDEISSDTGVLRNAEFIYSNAIDVSVDMYGTKAAAVEIYQMMRERGYSTGTWSEHDLHPKASEGFTELDIVNFVFTMDLQNYSFWSELSSDERFQVEYRGRRWTGYNSLVACLRRALDEGIPITTPRFWRSQRCTDELLGYVFRSATAEQIPLLEERIAVLRESSIILRENFPGDDDEREDENDVVVGAEEQPAVSIDNSVNVAEESPGQAAAEQLPMAINSTSQDGNVQSNADAEVNGVSADVDHLHIAEVSRSEDLPEIDAGSGEASGTTSNEPELQNGLDSSHQAAELSGQIDTPQGIEPPQPTDSSDGSALAPERPTETRPTDHQPDHAVIRLIQKSDQSAGKLVNLLAHHFPCFRDETRFEGRRVRLLKRAQIFVADLWAALSRTGLGEFHDIDHLTMFADYRVPQSLHSLGVLIYSPPLDYHIRSLRSIESGHSWEVQLRGCSIWAVELIRREILSRDPTATNINAVLIDFFLYDLAKEKESQGQHAIPHHRTRSIWY